MTAGHRLVEPWLPTPVLRTVRHQVNNMLAPIAVAAEIVDGDPATVDMLQRSTERLRRINERMALLVRPGDVDASLVAASTLDPRCAVHGHLQVDAPRLRIRLIEELDRNGARIEFEATSSGLPPGLTGEHLVVRSCVEDSHLSSVELDNLAVPLTMTGGGLGLAIACLETHLQGGRVAVSDDPRLIEFLLPIH